MLVRTGLCALLGVDVPVVQASLGPWSSVELAAAVSNAGGLGSLGTAVRSANAVRDDIARMRELTDRPGGLSWGARPRAGRNCAGATCLPMGPLATSPPLRFDQYEEDPCY